MYCVCCISLCRPTTGIRVNPLRLHTPNKTQSNLAFVLTEVLFLVCMFPVRMFLVYTHTLAKHVYLPEQAHNRYWSAETTYAKQNGGRWDFFIDTVSEDAQANEDTAGEGPPSGDTVGEGRVAKHTAGEGRPSGDTVGGRRTDLGLMALPVDELFWDQLMMDARRCVLVEVVFSSISCNSGCTSSHRSDGTSR